MADRALGVCYYPEHWHPDWWRADARRMAELGLAYVRIAEFAWSRMEPAEGAYEWQWLDDAIATLGAEGLRIVLCTPTPTPPKWLTDRYPEVLRCAEDGLPMKHGSRRHVSLASKTYRRQSARITAALVERYGENPHVAGWQTDNEFGCHGSTLSFGPEDRSSFSRWLERRYGSVGALNDAWGTAFWSQTYAGFQEVDLPNRQQAAPNPAHWLDFRRFFSDMTAEFNREQCAIIRAGSPGRFITHNAMMFEAGFDHWALARDLDFFSWDSYPLGYLRRLNHMAPQAVSDADVARYQHIGHPDILAYHHDLYRSQSGEGFWVMEQQPGPVNWASQNPAPVDGAVRCWTLEAMAHGAQVVSYFRWRQAAWAQEQMHSGLFTPWNEPDQAVAEIEGLVASLPDLPLKGRHPDPAATLGIYFDYESVWFFEALRQGEGLDPRLWTFDWYRAARRLGWNVEFFGPHGSGGDRLRNLKLAVFPTMPICKPELLAALLANTRAHLLFGPRSGSRTATLAFDNVSPSAVSEARRAAAPPYLTDGRKPLFAGLVVDRVESLPRESEIGVTTRANKSGRAVGWVEHLRLAEGGPCRRAATFDAPSEFRRGLDIAAVSTDRATYLGFQPDLVLMVDMMRTLAAELGLESMDLGPDLRCRRLDAATFWFNHGPDAIELPESGGTLQARSVGFAPG